MLQRNFVSDVFVESAQRNSKAMQGLPLADF